MHEVMCPADDSYHTYEFHDHFVIAPSIKFFHGELSFDNNAIGEKGELVEPGFEYQSGSNPDFLTVENIQAFENE